MGLNFGDSSTIDWNTVEDTTFELIPKGQYNCTIYEAEYELSQQSGQPMWSLGLEVAGGDHDGHKLRSFLSFSEKALPMTKGNIGRIAPQMLEMDDFNPANEELLSTLIDQTVVAEVSINRYQGERRNNVRRLMAADNTGTDDFV